MKRGVVLYWVLTVLLILAVNYYFKSHPMYVSRARKIDRNYSEFDKALTSAKAEKLKLTLVLGNSYVDASMFRDLPPIDGVFAFTVGGLSLGMLVDIFEHMPEDAPIETLLVGFGYNYATPLATSPEMYYRYWEKNPLLKAWWSIPLVRSGDYASMMVKVSIMCLLAGRDCATTEDGDTTEVGREKALSDQAMQKSIKQRYREYAPFVGSVSQEFSEHIIRLREICERRGVRLYAYTAPINSGIREKFAESFIEDFRNAVRNVGVTYVDLNEYFPDWDKSYFKDATHVNKKGAIETRPFLLKYISETEGEGSVRSGNIVNPIGHEGVAESSRISEEGPV